MPVAVTAPREVFRLLTCNVWTSTLLKRTEQRHILRLPDRIGFGVARNAVEVVEKGTQATTQSSETPWAKNPSVDSLLFGAASADDVFGELGSGRCKALSLQLDLPRLKWVVLMVKVFLSTQPKAICCP